VIDPWSTLFIGAIWLAGYQPPAGEPLEKMGPPPPGHPKIVGEPMPGWTRADQEAREGEPMLWTQLGPRPIIEEYWSGTDDASGRVVSVAPHPAEAKTVYIAAASGGIWKTTDGGVSWIPLTDELPVLNHGCVAVDPSDPDTVYAGTGEYTTLSRGDGLFRSSDGGATWERIATKAEVGETCSRILVDPGDSETIHLSGGGGYARTSDGGLSWDRSFTSSRISDLAMGSGDPNTLFLGQHGGGIWRSLDGGESWTKLAGGLPTTGVQRILLATAPSEPNVIYTAIINASSGLRGLYRSADGGNTWTAKPNTPDFPYPQGWYDAFLGVDPTDENTIYAGGVFPTYAVAGVIKSTDGGDSWVDISCPGSCLTEPNLHPDMHAIAFASDGTLWVGNDGGVWKSPDGGASWINTNATLNITQNYAIALSPADQTRVMGGTQDNGTVERQSNEEDWPQTVAGDGGFLAYDFDEPARRYTTYVRLSVYRLFGGSIVNISGPWSGDRRNFIAPLVMDPNDSATLYGGTYRVWRTQNASAAATWSAYSPDLTDGGTLNAIAAAVGPSGVLYTGSSDGKVFVKPSEAAAWQDRSSGLPTGQVSDIVIDPADPAHAFVAFHNTSGERILETTTSGSSWADATGSLIDGVAARALAVDWRYEPPVLLVGSGAGVYWSTNLGGVWVKDGTDLPNVNVGDLAIDPSSGTITVGSYGRGAWRASIDALIGIEVVFSDGFESGDLSAWSAVLP
jgi:photosystem II stability/assembly factor-like uncharacterized protein